nr:ribonuclease H-like domain-containing protein [Tanacetum cinerariifolium]
MIRRSQSGIVKPIDRLSLNTFLVSPIPKYLSDASKDLQWRNAMYDEYNALVKNSTWLLVPRPACVNMAFSPVIKPATIRTVLSLVVSRKWSIHQLDVKNSFLNGNLSETVDMDQPLGFVDASTTSDYRSLHNEFDMTDLRALNYFLGIYADHNSTSLFVSQRNNHDVVTFALEGLPFSYETISTVIVSREPFLDLKTVRSLLTTHEMRLKFRVQNPLVDATSASPMVLLAKSNTSARCGPFLEKVNNPCWSFAKGSCRFGDSCKYLHNGVQGKSTLLPRTSSSASSVLDVTRLDLDMLQSLLAKFGLNAPNTSTPSPLVAYTVSIPHGFPSVLAQLSAQPTYVNPQLLPGSFEGSNMGMAGLFPQGVQYPMGSLQQGVYYPQQGVQTLSGLPQGVHLVPGPSQPPVQFTTGVQHQQGGSFPGSVHLGQSPSMPFHLSQMFAFGSQVKNLIFVCQFVRDNSCTVEFDPFGFSVKDFITRRVLLYCDSTSDLYLVTKPSIIPHAFLTSQYTWHQRLGHPGSEVLRHLVSSDSISCNKEKLPVLCHACQVGKHVKLLFVSSSSSVTLCFDIVYSDLWTSLIPGLSGFQYYVLFLDHYSQYVWVYPLMNKSDVLSKFMLFRNYVRTQFKCEIKSFQCDHGGEFDNYAFHKLFHDNDTNHKLGPRATPFIFLGHAANHFGYHCLDLNTNKIIIFRHVTFDETVFPFPSTKSTTTPSYDFLDDSTDLIFIIIRTAPITPVPAPVHTPQVDVPTPPTPPTPHPPPTPQSVPQIVPEHALAPTNDSPTVSIHPMVTRSRVGTTRPNPRYVGHVSTISPLPRSYKQVFNDPNWLNAMFDEYNAPIKDKTWTSVPRPEGANIVRCMWLFRHKFLADGTLSRYKARLVANGSTQVEGVDVDETFSPVFKPGIIRTVLSLAISRHWPVHQLDVKNAFLHGDLAETGDDTTFLLLFVDDIVLTASSDLTRDSSGMFLSQRKYAMEILERAHMVGCNLSRAPVDTESKLGHGGTPVVDPTLYRSLVGSLQYLAFTRPDITYVMQQVCLYMHDPREPHFFALKWILRYVHGTLDYGLQLFSSTTDSLIAYSDVDWTGFPTTRRSTSGYCVFLLSCSSKRQPMLSRSSAETEYHGVANAVAETCWMWNLLREHHTPLSSATIVYCDNVSVVYLSSNPVQHQRTKHIEIDIHFVRDLVATGSHVFVTSCKVAIVLRARSRGPPGFPSIASPPGFASVANYPNGQPNSFVVRPRYRDFMTRRVLLRCDITGDLYPVTAPSSIPHVFLEIPPVLCHACQLGKYVRLPFVNSNTVVTSCFDIIHSDAQVSGTVHTQHRQQGSNAIPGRHDTISPSSVKFVDFNVIMVFVRDNNCTIEFDAFGFSVKDFMTRQAQQFSQAQFFGYLIMGPVPQAHPVSTLGHHTASASLASTTVTSDHVTTLPHAFTSGTLHNPVIGAWNMDTGASSHLNNSVTNLCEIFNTNFMTRRVLLRYDSTGDLYPVTTPSPIPHAFLVRKYTWHQRLGHPGGEVLRRLVSSNFISCNKEKPPVLCHACQLGKHVRLPFVSSSTKKYAIEILDRAHMANCNSSRNPIDTESKLGSDDDLVSDPTLYQSLACSLQYLTFTRPNISYAVQQPTLSRSSAEAEYHGVANVVAETFGYAIHCVSCTLFYLPLHLFTVIIAVLQEFSVNR